VVVAGLSPLVSGVDVQAVRANAAAATMAARACRVFMS
jgi:hypothetical protein